MITFADILIQWERFGIYDIILPFLLIFSVVYGILVWNNVFGKNKMVSVIVALVVGLMAIRSGYVSRFFSEIFPRLGVGLAVILSLLILVGLFVNDIERRYWMWGFALVGFVAWVISAAASFEFMGFAGSGNVSEYAGLIIGIVGVIGVIIAVASSGSSGNVDGKKTAKAIYPIPLYDQTG